MGLSIICIFWITVVYSEEWEETLTVQLLYITVLKEMQIYWTSILKCEKYLPWTYAMNSCLNKILSVNVPTVILYLVGTADIACLKQQYFLRSSIWFYKICIVTFHKLNYTVLWFLKVWCGSWHWMSLLRPGSIEIALKTHSFQGVLVIHFGPITDWQTIRQSPVLFSSLYPKPPQQLW